MAKHLNQILKYLSSCLHCGSFVVKVGHLCGPCAQVLEDLRLNEPLVIKPFLAQCLYRWTPGQSDVLSHLMLSLKGNRSRQAWKHYAQRFVSQHLRRILSYKKIVIVPAPPSKIGRVDHAALWAEAIAMCVHGHYLPVLRKKSQGRQRLADRGQRALIEMEVLENNTLTVLSKEQTLWIFADDIVTTGATARAAHIALGQPTNFEVWALAYRSLSCGASTDLLYNCDVKTNQHRSLFDSFKS